MMLFAACMYTIIIIGILYIYNLLLLLSGIKDIYNYFKACRVEIIHVFAHEDRQCIANSIDVYKTRKDI